ncbi:MAG: endonuclease III [Candidatus Nanoarchaeia archaeon]|nr:endonuclease III [Candidatus Nanoarchaeia archaeon]
MDHKKIIEILKKEVINFDVPVINLIAFQSNNPDKVLISAILSTRTKDKVTLEASERLFSKINNIKDLNKLKIEQIEKLIYPVGFYKIKAKHLKKLETLEKIPNTFENLIKIDGVGRKVANLFLSVVYGNDEICVDTHVHRISNRIGWVKTSNPFQTEKALKKILPKKYWKTINSILVAYGQKICTPINPKCSICKINKYCKKIF